MAVLRQAVGGRNGSCDTRFGEGLLDRFGHDLRVSVGKPRLCALLVDASVDEDRITLARRILTDAGFQVSVLVVDAFAFADAIPILEAFGHLGLTRDDAVCGLGGARFSSFAAFVSSLWEGGTTFACLPTTLEALTVVPATPYALDEGAFRSVVENHPAVAMAYGDPDLMDLSPDTESARLARALWIVSAAAESKGAYADLVGRSQAILDADWQVLGASALEAARSRGRVTGSQAPAVRMALNYGQTLYRALARLVDAEPSLLLAEGLRFAARLAVDVVNGSTDFVFEQDGLLERFGMDPVPMDLDPTLLLETMKEESFARGNRFLFCLPYDVGRIRMTPVEDDVLAAHLEAFCITRSRLSGSQGQS